MKITEQSIASFLANRRFNKRQNIIVPNVSWGLGFMRECDLLIVTSMRWAYEVEIKTSLADLKKDKNKQKWHNRIGCQETKPQLYPNRQQQRILRYGTKAY